MRVVINIAENASHSSHQNAKAGSSRAECVDETRDEKGYENPVGA